jgi:tRNA(fMet)-specific endonuclease VapC
VTYRYLLDTNIVSDLVRNTQGAVAAKVAAVGEATLATSIIVAAELRLGTAKKASPCLTAQIEAILALLPILPLEPPVDRAYGGLRAHLEAAGTPIGANDFLIAAHSLTLGLTVVTNNMREFERVPGLSVETWL